MARHSLLETLSIRPFRYLWFAQLISQVSLNMLTFILAIVIYSQTKSNASVSFLYVTIGLPAAIFGLVSGVFVDRSNKQWLLIWSTFVRALLIASLVFFHNSLLLIYSLSAIISLLSQFFVPAEASLIPHFVPRKLLLSANSLFTITFYSAIIGGFVLGGPLLAYLDINSLFLLLALFFMCACVFLFLLPKQVAGKKAEKNVAISFFAESISGLRYIFKLPLVIQAILLMTVSQAVIAIFATLGPGFADRILQLKLTDASIIILGPAALGMILGALLVPWLGSFWSRRQLIKTGVLSSGYLLVFVGILSYSPDASSYPTVFEHIFSVFERVGMLPLAVTAFFLLGVANSFIDVTCNTVLQEQTSDAMRGKVYGVLGSLIGGVAILPVMVSGIIADLFGIGNILLLVGLLLVGVGFYIRSKMIVVPSRNL